jgi:hypothetical protein
MQFICWPSTRVVIIHFSCSKRNSEREQLILETSTNNWWKHFELNILHKLLSITIRPAFTTASQPEVPIDGAAEKPITLDLQSLLVTAARGRVRSWTPALILWKGSKRPRQSYFMSFFAFNWDAPATNPLFGSSQVYSVQLGLMKCYTSY